jgi:hypothetical protein
VTKVGEQEKGERRALRLRQPLEAITKARKGENKKEKFY